MYNQLGYELGSWTVSKIGDSPEATSFALLDLEWDLLPDVFPPDTDPCPGLFASWIPYEPGRRLLEMGCGAGVAAVLAARHGCAVHALDVNPAAVRNTRRNAVRHGVADRVTALTSDLFDALDPGETFDVIFWNAPFIEAPDGRAYAGQIERAVFDPGYGLQRRFFADARRHLADDGRLYLGISEAMGNPDKTLRIAADAGFDGSRYRSEPMTMPAAEFDPSPAVAAHTDERGMVAMDFTLYEFRRR